MRLFPAPPEIGADTGFDQADLFQRQEFGDRLTRLIHALEHPAVLLLDAPWGAGKTTFVKMWEGSLRQQKIPAIHFDAFASDYMADPFTALAGEVLDLAKQHQSDASKVDEFRQKAWAVTKVLARHGLRIGVKVATQGLVDIGGSDDAKAGEKAIVDGVTDAADALLLKRLENHAEERASFAAFRETLAELTTTLAPADQPEGERRPPLVFVIDELDRCRPTFALSLLETVKHFFDVDGVVFLLVTNLAQLEKSVEFAYGAGIDARGYLEKFFHVRAVMPTKPTQVETDASTYVRHLAQSMSLKNPHLSEALIRLAEDRKLNFRTIERLMANLVLYEISSQHQQRWFVDVVASLSLMKLNDPKRYALAQAGQLDWAEALEWGVKDITNYERDPTGHTISQEWKYCCGAPLSRNGFSDFHGFLGVSRENVLPTLCRHIDGFALPDDR
ncbi:KAP family P-loop NTPase fold protein [Magnetospirillum sulfuroxidans]|uniref:KAP NTPase domain-containing protein n=1 Tax=Magnetospirillum sulfuroxidans TaxID=611300 RepID=A0ABS5IC48_9PROT|nr:P-loop NTPase fold protein [Magnetospirillum sulfuroxidans]MBR9971884.1 hypothetical protein [Magnetospirillum sulfuroxidans]